MSSRTRRDKQATARLALISIPLAASIGFALFSLIAHWLDSDVWAWLTMFASALFGTLGLLAGTITLIFQMTRRQVNLRNVIAFGCLYVLAVFVFLGSCVSLIDNPGPWDSEDSNDSGMEAPSVRIDWLASRITS